MESERGVFTEASPLEVPAALLNSLHCHSVKCLFYFPPAISRPCHSFIKYSPTLHLVHRVTSAVRAQNQNARTLWDMPRVISARDAASPLTLTPAESPA